MSKKNILEINGNRYDAQTGELLSHHAGAVRKTIQHIDGVKHAAPNHAPASHHVRPKTQARPIHDVARPKARPAAKHAPQPAKTLMRHAVKKPTPQPRQHSKATHPLHAPVKQPKFSLAVKASAHNVDSQRLRRAKHVSKSHAIQRFGTPKTAPLLIAPAEPIIAQSSMPPASFSPRTQPARTKKPQTTAALLQHALDQATSHRQPAMPAKKQKLLRARRITSISAMSLAGVALFIAVGFQNVTTVKLQFASAKAGFAVSLPDQRPAGYRLSNLAYSNGHAAIHFESNTDERRYSITEKVSNWNSQTLRENFLATQAKEYEPIEIAGQTIFLYDQSNATWVSGGVWYQVESNGSLSSRQLLDLATSM